MKVKKMKKYFTLTEMIIVIAIIAILASIVSPMVFKHLSKANISKTQSQIKMLEDAVISYRLDVGEVPDETEGLEALVRNVSNSPKWQGPYLSSKKIPLDSWGRPYIYKVPGEVNDFIIISYGKDGTAGGNGENMDITTEDIDGTNAAAGNK